MRSTFLPLITRLHKEWMYPCGTHLSVHICTKKETQGVVINQVIPETETACPKQGGQVSTWATRTSEAGKPCSYPEPTPFQMAK